jgi:hypothetical protein
LQGKCRGELTVLFELVLSVILMASLVPVDDPDHVLVALLLQSEPDRLLKLLFGLWGGNVIVHGEIEFLAIALV